MRGLYKGKYLIAVCDRKGNVLDVGLSIAELARGEYRPELYAALSKSRIGKYKYKYVLIDCLEKHDDIFAEEDQIFLDFVESITPKSPEERAKELGMSVRNMYRKQEELKKYEDKQKNL